MFRRIASKSRKNAAGEQIEIFLSIPTEQGYVIRDKLLQALGRETVRNIRNKIGDAVAEVAREYSDNGRAPLVQITGITTDLNRSTMA